MRLWINFVVVFLCSESSTMFSCNWCFKSYRTRSKWLAHTRTHTGERPYICSYPCCGKSYTRSDHLRRHEWSHQERRPFVCSRVSCNKSFATKQRLQRHEQSHTEKRAFICKFSNCGVSFRKKRQLAEHYNSSHASKSFCSYSDSMEETQPHNGEIVHWIDSNSCSSSLSSSFQVPEHWIAFSYFCSDPDCTEGFKSFAELSSHLHKVHKKSWFSCNYCSKTFSKYCAWLRHLSTHQEDVQVRQVFPCHFPNCSKKFTSSYNLSVHEKTVHKKEYRVECSFCCKQFGLDSSLRRHIRNVHRETDTNFHQKDLIGGESCVQTSLEKGKTVTGTQVLKALCGTS